MGMYHQLWVCKFCKLYYLKLVQKEPDRFFSNLVEQILTYHYWQIESNYYIAYGDLILKENMMN